MRVFLTGASSGLGEALARHYAAARRDARPLRARANPSSPGWRRAGARDGRAPTPGTCAIPPTLRRAAADFIARFGVPDVVIANAGISRGTLTDAPRGPARCSAPSSRPTCSAWCTRSRPSSPPCARRGAGALVGVASVAGFRGLPGFGCVLRLEGGGDQLPRIAARRAARHRRGGGDDVPGLRRHAADGAQSLPDAVPDPGRQGGALMARAIARRRRSTCCRGRWPCWAGAALAAAPGLRRRRRRPRAQAARLSAAAACQRRLGRHRARAALPAPRIASLVPSLTELLFALDLGAHVVARTGFCVHPRDARRVPKVGGTKDPDLDAAARAGADAPRGERRREPARGGRRGARVRAARHRHASAGAGGQSAAVCALRRDLRPRGAGGRACPAHARRRSLRPPTRGAAARDACSTSSGASRG